MTSSAIQFCFVFHLFLTVRQRSCRTLMFSVVSVRPNSVQGGGSLYGEVQCIMGNGHMGWSLEPFSRLKVQKLRDQSEVSVRSGYGLGMHVYGLGYYGGIHTMYGVSTEWVQTEGGGGMTILV